MENEIKDVMGIVCTEIGRFHSKEKEHGYLDKNDKEFYESCMEAFKKLYEKVI